MSQQYLQYGVAVRPLSDYLDRFCLKDVWKDMYRNTIWDIKRVVLDVCKDTHTITLPKNCSIERVINFSVIDCYNHLHPLTQNTNINTTEIVCQKGACSCNNCGGHDTLCPIVDNLTVTVEYVTIQDEQYPLTTWIRYQPSGALQKQVRTPNFDVTSGTIVYQDAFTTLCNLETTSNGCIKPTRPNMELLRVYCGWDGLGWNGIAYNNTAFRPLIPTTISYWGEYNYNANDPQKIHIYHGRHGDCDHNNWNNIRSVIVTYKTNGDVPGEEILIPEYCQMAMDAGMIWQQKSLNPRDGDKGSEAYNKYRREKTKVFLYLNPVTLQTMQNLQQAPHRW